MDNEFESMRELLGKLPEKGTPAGFTAKLMEEVRQIEQRRIYRRLVLALVLRSVVIVGVLLALFLPLIVHGFSADAGWHLVGTLEQAGKWVLANVYFLFPLIVLVFVRRLLVIK